MQALLVIAMPVALIAAVYIAIKGFMRFDLHVHARFGHRFFRFWHFLAIIVGTFLLPFGKWLRVITVDTPSHGTNGIVLMFFGAVLLGIVLCTNYRNTNAFYGSAGTVIEIAVSPFVLCLGAFFVVCLLLGGAGGFLTAKPVYGINPR